MNFFTKFHCSDTIDLTAMLFEKCNNAVKSNNVSEIRIAQVKVHHKHNQASSYNEMIKMY